MTIDASAAPGLTIEGAPGLDHRLFYVGPAGGLNLYNVILSGGEATGPGSNASGGAIYDDDLVHVQFRDCWQLGGEHGYPSSGDSAQGGAVMSVLTRFSSHSTQPSPITRPEAPGPRRAARSSTTDLAISSTTPSPTIP